MSSPTSLHKTQIFLCPLLKKNLWEQVSTELHFYIKIKLRWSWQGHYLGRMAGMCENERRFARTAGRWYSCCKQNLMSFFIVQEYLAFLMRSDFISLVQAQSCSYPVQGGCLRSLLPWVVYRGSNLGNGCGVGGFWNVICYDEDTSA